MISSIKRMRLLPFLALAAFCLISADSIAGQATVTFEPANREVKVGETLVVIITPGAGVTIDPATVGITGAGLDNFSVSACRQADAVIRCELTATKPATGPIALSVEIAGQPAQPFTAKVASKFAAGDYNFTALDTAAGAPVIANGKSVAIPIPLQAAALTAEQQIKARSADETALTANILGNNLVLVPKTSPASPVRVELVDRLNEAIVIKSVQFTLIPGIKSISLPITAIDLNYCDPTYLARFTGAAQPREKCKVAIEDLGIAITGTDGSTMPLTELRFGTENSSAVTIDPTAGGKTYIRPLRNESTVLIIEAIDRNKFADTIRIPINVRPVAARVDISSSDARGVLAKNNPITLKARVVDNNGQEDRAKTAQIEWEVLNSAGTKYLGNTVLSNVSADRSTLSLSIGLEPTGSETIRVRASYKENGVVIDDDEIMIFVQPKIEIKDFRPLKVQLKVVDTRTARDFFGATTANEYYVVEARLFNALKREDGEEFLGDPILVYGSSFEAMVAFKYRIAGTEPWINASELPPFAVPPVIPPPPLQPAIPPTSLRYADGLVIPQRTMPSSGNKFYCQDYLPQYHFVLPYRPLDYTTALYTHDRRSGRTKRNIVLAILNGASTLASFVTTIAVPPPGNDLKPALDNFRNLLIPGFERFFPDLNEAQRQNMVNKAMLPLEEIPFGGEIVKYLFFPKDTIRGYVVGTDARPVDVRITGINGSDACAVVAVIKKVQ